MADLNRLSASILPADNAAIIAAIATIQTKLPFLVGLSDADRGAMPKMAEKSEGFHDKAKTYMASNPEFLPGFINKAEFDKDQALRDQMLQFWTQFSSLFRAVEDTLMVVNSELWMADLAYYQNVRAAASRGVPAAQAIYNDLRERFSGRPLKKITP